MILYGYWRSSASWRVRLGLELKGLSYRTVPVHLVRSGGEQHTADHARRNPMQQVPVLEVEGRRLTQSLAILRYLDRRWPDPPLFPSDPWAEAHALELAEIVNAGIQPLQNLWLLQQLDALGADRIAWGRRVIEKGLDAMEELSADTSGDFLLGATLSVADVCLVPQLYNARRFGVDLTRVPNLIRIEARCAEISAFRAAHPDRQPDAQPT